MAETYINAQRQARLYAQDFLAANPRMHSVIMPGLYIDRAGHVSVTHRPDTGSQRVAVPANSEQEAA